MSLSSHKQIALASIISAVVLTGVSASFAGNSQAAVTGSTSSSSFFKINISELCGIFSTFGVTAPGCKDVNAGTTTQVAAPAIQRQGSTTSGRVQLKRGLYDTGTTNPIPVYPAAPAAPSSPPDTTALPVEQAPVAPVSAPVPDAPVYVPVVPTAPSACPLLCDATHTSVATEGAVYCPKCQMAAAEPVSTCGDGICQTNEKPYTCDAPPGVVCKMADNPYACPQDCAVDALPAAPVCGDGICQNTADYREGTTGCDPFTDPVTGKSGGCNVYHICMSDCGTGTKDITPVVTTAVCGNGKLEAGEICDDGNTVDHDGCNSKCQQDYVISPTGVPPETAPVVDPLACPKWSDCPGSWPNSTCAEGNNDKNTKFDCRRKSLTSPCEWVETACTLGYCGDKKITGNEQCDNGMPPYSNGDCHYCRFIPRCGNGKLEGTEQCDDGNTNDDDGCSTQCQVIAKKPVCGNGIKEYIEACDDGNSNDYDNCTNACQVNNPSLGRDCGGVTRAADYVKPDLSLKVHAMTVIYEDKTTKAFPFTNDCKTGLELMALAKAAHPQSPVCPNPLSVFEDSLANPYCNGSVQKQTAVCGNGIVEGNEVCDNGGKDEYACNQCSGSMEDARPCSVSECAGPAPKTFCSAAMSGVQATFACNRDYSKPGRVCRWQVTNCGGNNWCGDGAIQDKEDNDGGIGPDGYPVNGTGGQNCHATACTYSAVETTASKAKNQTECGNMTCSVPHYNQMGQITGGTCECKEDSQCATGEFCLKNNNGFPFVCVKK